MVTLRREITCPRCGGLGVFETVDPAALRARRKAAEVSLSEMARRIGFSIPYISDIERGRRDCPAAVEREYLKLKVK